MKLRWRCVGLMLLACNAVVPSATSSATSSPSQQAAKAQLATVLDVRAMARVPKTTSHALRELSGLDWDAKRQVLVAVTDRGWLLEFTLDPRANTLAGLELLSATELVPSAKPRVNGESVVARPDAWWVADETRRRVLEFKRDGSLRAEMALPGALGQHAAFQPAGQPADQQADKRGVEALAQHARHGLLAVLQRPQTTDPPGMHLVHAEHGGRTWAVAHTPGGRSTIKAADLRGDDLRLLEKLDPSLKGAPHRYFVHEIKLAANAANTAQPGRTWFIDDARLSGHNFEGLACLDDLRCVLVSDGGADKASERTMFVLLRLP
jgi:Esterase-like activity of phytase